MGRRAAAIASVIGLGVAGVAAAAPAHVEARRGIGGAVPAGGIDVVEVAVTSGADVATEVAVEVDDRAHRLALPARGRATLIVGRRVPPGAASLPPATVRVGAAQVEVAAVPVIRRPVLVVADDPLRVIPVIDRWRRDEGLGEPVAITPEALPRRWQALVGVGAIVLDRPVAALDPAAARTLGRYQASGGAVCTIPAAAVRCARRAPVATPRTPVAASSAAGPRALAAAAGLLALALAIGARLGRAVAGVAVIAAMLASAWAPTDDHALRGVRVATADGEQWVAAELGVAGAPPRLDGDLWIEPSPPPSALPPLDAAGLTGQVPAAGSWRIRGFVAADAGWARGLEAR